MSLTEYSSEKTEAKKIKYNVKEDVKEMPDTLEAIIISIEKKNASEVFGDKLKGVDRKVLHLTYENKTYNIVNQETISYFPNGEVPDKSKLAKFLKRYEDLEEGMTIKLLKNEEGFYKMLI